MSGNFQSRAESEGRAVDHRPLLAVERRQTILERLRESGSVTVAELSRVFDVSEETIRRDLTKMEAGGLLQKTYGGAFFTAGMHREVPVTLRERTYVEGKNLIGTLAAELVHNGDTVFLDASTTAVHIAERILNKKNLIVITNALKVAETLAQATSMKVICTGGTLRASSMTMVGRAAETAIERFFADKAFICCDGVDRDHGVTDANEREAEVRRAMMRQSRSSILVVDATKFDHTYFVRMADLCEFDALITDREPPDDWRDTLEDADIECRHAIREGQTTPSFRIETLS